MACCEVDQGPARDDVGGKSAKSASHWTRHCALCAGSYHRSSHSQPRRVNSCRPSDCHEIALRHLATLECREGGVQRNPSVAEDSGSPYPLSGIPADRQVGRPAQTSKRSPSVTSWTGPAKTAAAAARVSARE